MGVVNTLSATLVPAHDFETTLNCKTFTIGKGVMVNPRSRGEIHRAARVPVPTFQNLNKSRKRTNWGNGRDALSIGFDLKRALQSQMDKVMAALLKLVGGNAWTKVKEEEVGEIVLAALWENLNQ